MSTALTTRPDTGFLTIDSFDQAIKVADYINKSALVPDAYRGKPADIVIAMQYGMELGLSPMQALQSVAVINGKPSIYGDALPAVVMLHPDFEDIDLSEPHEANPDAWMATCTVKRRGRTPTVRTFSTADAKTAKLWGKAGPWTTNPKRMLMMRARAFALRDAFPDRMKGLTTVEEAIDVTPERVEPSEPRRMSETTTPAAVSVDDQVWKASAQSAARPAQAIAAVDEIDRVEAARATPPVAAAPASPSSTTSTGVQLTTGVKIDDTKVAFDPKTKQTTYEVYAKKGHATVCFLTHEKDLYDQAASCEGTDHLFTISYTRGRHNNAPAFIMTAITLEEQDDATVNPEQGTLPTGGDDAVS